MKPWYTIPASTALGAAIAYVAQHNLDPGETWKALIMGAVSAAAIAVVHLYMPPPPPSLPGQVP